MIPDHTLGAESSVVTPDTIQEMESDRISGGAIRGSNLFHSFREFNIREGRGGYFENPAAIENIFSRVTGSNPSEILGTLGVLGKANLFFLNPNGILFGPNARLDVRGSFLATTADSILFPDGRQFSATNPEAPPILKVNVQQPIGLEFEGKEGTISHRGNLVVDSGQNLALVGVNVSLDGGSLIAPGGRVELGGLSAAGEIGINADGSLSFPDEIERADVTFTNAADVNVFAAGGGSITVNARNIEFSGDLSGGEFSASTLRAGIAPNSGSTAAQAGDITLNATDTVSLSQSVIVNQVSSTGVGNAGEIKISTNSLSLTNSFLFTSTFGQGNAGSVFIQAQDSVSLTNSFLFTSTFGQGNAGSVFIQAQDSVSVKDKSLISTGVEPFGVGKGGDININAASLSVEDGSQLISAIFFNRESLLAGRGDAGNINIDVTGAVTIAGVTRAPSGLFSLVSRGGVGNGGNITISANSFSLLGGANIFANTNGQGNAGTIQINANNSVTISGTSPTRGDSSEISARTNSSNRGGDIIINTRNFNLSNGGVVNAQTVNNGNGGKITVNARQVEVINGGQILSDTSGRGNAGKITVNATDRVIVDGIDATLNDRIAKFGNNRLARFGTSRGITNTLENGASGFFVRSQGTGSAGDIEITSPKIQLDNQGRLFADSASGNGGNIGLQVGELLLLRRDSAISATAGTAQAGGDGGNITIDAPFVIAFPNEDSNIQANAFEGGGGNITINTNGIFGIEFRDQETPLSDITASSEFGRQGEVEINPSAVDPTRGLDNLPQETVEAQVAQGCQTVGGQATLAFFNIGRGGLPPSPDALFSSEIVIAEWIPLGLTDEKTQAPTSEKRFTGNELNNITLLTTFPCRSN